jgi:hypothetical protein
MGKLDNCSEVQSSPLEVNLQFLNHERLPNLSASALPCKEGRDNDKFMLDTQPGFFPMLLWEKRAGKLTIKN